MLNVIGLTQFVFLSLGIMAVKIITKASGGQTTPLAEFLAQHGLWLFLVPVIWLVTANVVTLQRKTAGLQQAFQILGILLTMAIFAVFGMAILGS